MRCWKNTKVRVDLPVEERMKEKILVVDDDKSMVNMIKDVLEMEGYAVTTAFDGEQALKQSKSSLI